MATSRIAYRLTTLETARDCALLGAHQRTIASLTGLPSSYIRESVFDAENPTRIGRPRYKDDYIFNAPLRVFAEACSIALRYDALIRNGFSRARSLIGAYREHAAGIVSPRLGFDEAFYIIDRLHGRWLHSTPSLQMVSCPRCGCPNIAPIGNFNARDCRFCTIVLRLKKGVEAKSVESSRPGLKLPQNQKQRSVGDSFQQHIEATRFKQSVQALGASDRVVDALLSSRPGTPAGLMETPPTRLVVFGRPIPLARWSKDVSSLRRAAYSLVTKHFEALVANGFSFEVAMVAAYAHVATLSVVPITFDRSFEVASLLSARWGVTSALLTLRPCGKCGSVFLHSLADRHGVHCPFCNIWRFPNKYSNWQPEAQKKCARGPVAPPLST